MDTLRKMWELAAVPPAPVIVASLIGVVIWAWIFRARDPIAWKVGGVLLACWGAELGTRTVLDDTAFRAFLALSDLACAYAVLKLGSERHAEWALAVYATLVYSILAHVLWLLGVFQVFGTRNDYIAILNTLLVLRLICIAFPGAAYVGEAIRSLLPHRRFAFARVDREE